MPIDFSFLKMLSSPLIKGIIYVVIILALFAVMRPYAENFMEWIKYKKEDRKERLKDKKYMKWNKDKYLKANKDVKRDGKL